MPAYLCIVPADPESVLREIVSSEREEFGGLSQLASLSVDRSVEIVRQLGGQKYNPHLLLTCSAPLGTSIMVPILYGMFTHRSLWTCSAALTKREA